MDAQKESPENEWRRKNRKCKSELVRIDYRDISWCYVREERVNPERRKLFCPCFVLKEFN